ncbi:hypothetical protein VNO77_44625 [Canavalia gladiata]|uniref:Uncharacterized protein n=1 Tax=Canavalia gladiata TaxID=3824 RepID=A0AAN9JYJ7_CANGL
MKCPSLLRNEPPNPARLGFPKEHPSILRHINSSSLGSKRTHSNFLECCEEYGEREKRSLDISLAEQIDWGNDCIPFELKICFELPQPTPLLTCVACGVVVIPLVAHL